MRDNIKEVATQLLIQNGYQGFRFRDIATQLNVTRANVHYHFGNKQQLAEEVIVEYVADALNAYQAIWLDPCSTLDEKINRLKDETKKRYLKYNPTGRTGAPWSLLARMRFERDLLSDKAREAVEMYGERLESVIFEGMAMAVQKKELSPDTPIKDISFQLVTVTNSAGPITQDSGSFDRLEELYCALARIIQHAFGNAPAA
ncbi:bacterial regulatory s, tetR family protein [Paraburkholderia fungorum]|uniref:Bacterial regulatory s, tetR family protein n=1 Tax=Paraburkholderia fungorum TaxID=134537 RepID=A0AAU8SU69_9BURK|nr:TetR family transcriptional regulator [Paraburkholderia fungorum]AJZ56937.1 bacterial regulatory s, tetR family protein [Paraburkholderia fungorum]